MSSLECGQRTTTERIGEREAANETFNNNYVNVTDVSANLESGMALDISTSVKYFRS